MIILWQCCIDLERLCLFTKVVAAIQVLLQHSTSVVGGVLFCSYQAVEQSEEGRMLDQTDITMNHRPWGTLPEDLLDRVLARLPIHTLFQLRSINKKLNSIIYSDGFVKLYTENWMEMQPWFLLTTVGNMVCTFNPALNKWHNIPLPTVAPRMRVVAASSSLLCFGDQIGECSVLSVCNPLIKSVRDLPPMLHVRLIHKLAILADMGSKSYKIMVAGEDGYPPDDPYVYNLSTEVYDSTTRRWTMTGNPLPDAKFGSDPGVWCNGLYYCITEMPYGVVLYDPDQGVWSDAQAEMPKFLATPSLVQCQGRLLMVGKVLSHATTLATTESIRIWELKRATMEWIEVQKLPGRLYTTFLEPLAPFTPIVGVGLGDLVCFTTHLSPHAIVHNLATTSWHRLPRDSLFPSDRNFHMLGFAFEPRLDLYA
jgi:hypothetical protein